jgi:hypothetical protein
MPNKVFISYRREDSRYQARRVYDAFVHALPPDTVFMDVDSIPPGADFVEILEGWVKQCDVLLALIGPNWLNSIDPRTGLRRLDSPEDFVRIEVRGALRRKIPVVPVLLDATEMPTAAELPDDIKALRRRHAEFVDFRTFDTDVQRLIKRLKIGKKAELPSLTAGPQAGDDGPRTVIAEVHTFLQRIKPNVVAAKPLLLAAAAVLVLLAVGSAAYVMNAGTRVDASAGLADFAKSEEGRRTAEARASQATDALAIAEKARRDAEAAAATAAAAQAKSEEGRRAAEARAGEAADALAKAEKARQEVEAKATAAVAALTKTEENRRAAEARANDAADTLKKSDKARLDAEARATSAAAAQAKAEEGLRTAEKARFAAETAATVATTAKAQADNSRQFAEVRANDAAEALRKSEEARRQAEAKLAALTKDQESNKGPSRADNPANVPSKTGLFLADMGSSTRWARNGPANCGNRDQNYYSMTANADSITWTSGVGDLDVELITSSGFNEFGTRTQKSEHVRSGSPSPARIGTTWTYSRDGERMRVQSNVGHFFTLVRCP